MRIAALQYDVAWMDRAANWRTVDRLLASANLPRGTFALLPELGDTGFTMDPPPASGPDPVQAASERAKRDGIWLQVGHAECGADGMRNAATIVAPDGSVRGTYRKIHLFSPGNEDRHYRPGESVTVIDVASDDGTWRVAPAICYDLRFPELYRALSPVDLLVIPSSFTARTGAAHWEVLLRARAIENQCWVLAPAQGGVHAGGRRTWGHSMLIDPWGEIVAERTEPGEGVLVATIDRGRINEVRAGLPALAHRVM